MKNPSPQKSEGANLLKSALLKQATGSETLLNYVEGILSNKEVRPPDLTTFHDELDKYLTELTGTPV